MDKKKFTERRKKRAKIFRRITKEPTKRKCRTCGGRGVILQMGSDNMDMDEVVCPRCEMGDA